jgi:hypothetical protein
MAVVPTHFRVLKKGEGEIVVIFPGKIEGGYKGFWEVACSRKFFTHYYTIGQINPVHKF